MDLMPTKRGAVIHQPGIYFGLDDDSYHADEALGSTALKEIAIDPVDWQYERLHGTDEETPYLIFGSALHARALEGRTAFERKFYCEAQKADHPGALVTADHLRSFIRERGGKLSGTKPELIARALEHPDCPPIWERVEAAHNAQHAGKTALTARQWKAITVAAEWMQNDQWLKDVMEGGAFVGGMPEVSVFYLQDGVRLKARFDYLAKHAIFDLKSFSVMYRETAVASIGKTIGRQRYDLQAAAYVKAWHAAQVLWRNGQVFGQYPGGFLAEVFSRPAPLWIWIMLKTTGAPQCYVRPFDQRSNAFKLAEHQVEQAIKSYRENVAKFGTDADWIPDNPVHNIEDTDIPAWVGR